MSGARERDEAARRRIEQLKPRWLGAHGRMRRHLEACLVDEFLGDGGREVVREHDGLELVECLTIEDCDLEAVVALLRDPPPALLKKRLRELPAHVLPRFEPPADRRKLRERLLDFVRENCEDPSAVGLAPWFAIKNRAGGASA